MMASTWEEALIGECDQKSDEIAALKKKLAEQQKLLDHYMTQRLRLGVQIWRLIDAIMHPGPKFYGTRRPLEGMWSEHWAHVAVTASRAREEMQNQWMVDVTHDMECVFTQEDDPKVVDYTAEPAWWTTYLKKYRGDK